MTNPPSTAPDGATADSGVKLEDIGDLLDIEEGFDAGEWNNLPAGPAPGPWDALEDGAYVMLGGSLTEIVALVFRRRDSDRFATARLLAAAPDLLEALQAALPLLAHEYGEYADTEPEARALKQAWRAIAKALGQ